MKGTSIIRPEIISKHINESLSGIRSLGDGRAKDREKGFYLTEKEYEHLMSVFSDGNVEYLSSVISNAYNKIHKDLFDTKILAATPYQGWVFKNKNTDLSRWTELYGYGVLMDIVNISENKSCIEEAVCKSVSDYIFDMIISLYYTHISKGSLSIDLIARAFEIPKEQKSIEEKNIYINRDILGICEEVVSDIFFKLSKSKCSINSKENTVPSAVCTYRFFVLAKIKKMLGFQKITDKESKDMPIQALSIIESILNSTLSITEYMLTNADLFLEKTGVIEGLISENKTLERAEIEKLYIKSLEYYSVQFQLNDYKYNYENIDSANAFPSESHTYKYRDNVSIFCVMPTSYLKKIISDLTEQSSVHTLPSLIYFELNEKILSINGVHKNLSGYKDKYKSFVDNKPEYRKFINIYSSTEEISRFFRELELTHILMEDFFHTWNMVFTYTGMYMSDLETSGVSVDINSNIPFSASYANKYGGSGICCFGLGDCLNPSAFYEALKVKQNIYTITQGLCKESQHEIYSEVIKYSETFLNDQYSDFDSDEVDCLEENNHSYILENGIFSTSMLSPISKRKILQEKEDKMSVLDSKVLVKERNFIIISGLRTHILSASLKEWSDILASSANAISLAYSKSTVSTINNNVISVHTSEISRYLYNERVKKGYNEQMEVVLFGNNSYSDTTLKDASIKHKPSNLITDILKRKTFDKDTMKYIEDTMYFFEKNEVLSDVRKNASIKFDIFMRVTNSMNHILKYFEYKHCDSFSSTIYNTARIPSESAASKKTNNKNIIIMTTSLDRISLSYKEMLKENKRLIDKISNIILEDEQSLRLSFNSYTSPMAGSVINYCKLVTNFFITNGGRVLNNEEFEKEEEYKRKNFVRLLYHFMILCTVNSDSKFFVNFKRYENFAHKDDDIIISNKKTSRKIKELASFYYKCKFGLHGAFGVNLDTESSEYAKEINLSNISVSIGRDLLDKTSLKTIEETITVSLDKLEVIEKVEQNNPSKRVNSAIYYHTYSNVISNQDVVHEDPIVRWSKPQQKRMFNVMLFKYGVNTILKIEKDFFNIDLAASVIHNYMSAKVRSILKGDAKTNIFTEQYFLFSARKELSSIISSGKSFKEFTESIGEEQILFHLGNIMSELSSFYGGSNLKKYKKNTKSFKSIIYDMCFEVAVKGDMSKLNRLLGVKARGLSDLIFISKTEVTDIENGIRISRLPIIKYVERLNSKETKSILESYFDLVSRSYRNWYDTLFFKDKYENYQYEYKKEDGSIEFGYTKSRIINNYYSEVSLGSDGGLGDSVLLIIVHSIVSNILSKKIFDIKHYEHSIQIDSFVNEIESMAYDYVKGCVSMLKPINTKISSVNRLKDEHDSIYELVNFYGDGDMSVHPLTIATKRIIEIISDRLSYDYEVITTGKRLLEEGTSQNHCVYGRKSYIEEGSSVIVHFVNEENRRVTTQFNLNYIDGVLDLHESKTTNNIPPSKICEDKQKRDADIISSVLSQVIRFSSENDLDSYTLKAFQKYKIKNFWDKDESINISDMSDILYHSDLYFSGFLKDQDLQQSNIFDSMYSYYGNILLNISKSKASMISKVKKLIINDYLKFMEDSYTSALRNISAIKKSKRVSDISIVRNDSIIISGYKDEPNTCGLPVAKTKIKGFSISRVGLQMYSWYDTSVKNIKSSLDGFPENISKMEDDIIF